MNKAFFRTIFFEGTVDVERREDLERYILKDESGSYLCALCSELKPNKARSKVWCHIESKHFPNTFTYQCEICFQDLTTRKAYQKHIDRHKSSAMNLI